MASGPRRDARNQPTLKQLMLTNSQAFDFKSQLLTFKSQTVRLFMIPIEVQRNPTGGLAFVEIICLLNVAIKLARGVYRLRTFLRKCWSDDGVGRS